MLLHKMWESPYLTCLVLYIFSFQIIATNSRTSNIWKLDIEEGQIVDGNTLSQVSLVYTILYSFVHSLWKIQDCNILSRSLTFLVHNLVSLEEKEFLIEYGIE